MDALKTIHSNYFLTFSISEQENKSYRKETEKENYNMTNIDIEGNYCPIHDNLAIISQPSLNKFENDNSIPSCIEEDNKEKICSFFIKTESENNDRENDIIFEDNHGEMIFINNEIDKKEEELFHLQEFECNGNKIEEKEKDEFEIKKEEKNTKQKVNDRNIKLLNKKEQLFLIIKRGRNEKKKNTQRGRKRKEEKNKGINGSHTRDSEDNKILKIKSYFWKSLYSFIRDSFLDKYEFLKLEVSINKNLKKKFNENLFKMKLKDIYSIYKISKKYRKHDKDINKNLINKIYKEHKEKVVIKILNLTYIEAFDIFRRKIKDLKPELINKVNKTDILDNKKFKDFDDFLEKIREEEEEEGNNIGDIEEYINDIKRLCLQFEEWFKQKSGRNRSNNIK